MFSDQREQRKFHSGLLFLILTSLILLVVAYTIIDNNYVRVERVEITIPGMDTAYEGFTILHISDLHGKRFSAAQRQLADALRNDRYNIVCITGDVTAADGDPYAFYELLDVLDPTKPVFFIAGDDDPPALIGEPHYLNDVFAEFITGAQRKGAVYLDAPQEIQFNGRTIWLLPGTQLSLDLDAAESRYRGQLRSDQTGGNAHTEGIKARERLLTYQLDVIDRTRTARETMEQTDLRIALVHFPFQSEYIRTLQTPGGSGSTVYAYTRMLDLVLAGHYNGGQVCLPYIGPIYVTGSDLPRGGWFPGYSHATGFTQIAGIAQYITPGLGVSKAYRLPFRLFNSPKVSLLHLRSSLPAQ